jgi:hypothetical protein
MGFLMNLLSFSSILTFGLIILWPIVDCPLRGKQIKLPQIHHRNRPNALLNVESKRPFAI